MSHPLLARLASPDAAERRAACLAAVDDPSAVLLLEPVARALGDPVNAVSRAASDALVRLAARHREVEETLRGALRSDDPRRRFGAAYTQARLRPPGPQLLPAAVEALGSADGDMRWAAARLLVDMGRLHGEVLGVLLGLAAAAESPLVRRMAAFALRELAPDRPEAARALVLASRDSDRDVRRAATSALAGLLDPPREVPARLLEALGADPDAGVRRIAAVALGELCAERPEALPAGALEALRRAGDETEDASLRRAAARALERLGGAGLARGER